MVYPLYYRRPGNRSPSQNSLSGEEKQRSIQESVESVSSGLSNGIPEALSFERITNGGTCPPLTLRDFLNYLKYIEHNAENLQFFMWLREYAKRFEELPTNEKALSPEWTQTQTDAEVSNLQSQARKIQVSTETAAALKGTGLDLKTAGAEAEKSNPFSAPARKPSQESDIPASSQSSFMDGLPQEMRSSSNSDIKMRVEGAFGEAGAKWQPFTIQPFRDEISRIISIYIADGGCRQLNLSAKERNSLLHALKHTTHPSAFRQVRITAEWSLRCQSHPNFIRWAICNGNRPRVLFARGLGTFGIIAGLVAALLITLSGVNRAWRILALPLLMIGFSTLIAAWKGMCVVLHGMHHRHLRPWELFQDEDDATVELKNNSMTSFLTSSTNSYEDEPWVARYQKRNIIRKVFDRERWIEEPALRQIQDTIFMQSLLGAFVGAAILISIFVAVPAGHFY